MQPTILNVIFIFEKETAIVQHFVQIYISMFWQCGRLHGQQHPIYSRSYFK